MLAIRRQAVADWTSRSTCADNASPASTTVSAVTATVRWAITWANADGTALTRLATQPPCRDSPSASRSRTTSTVPPATSGQKISNTDTSKLSEVEATTHENPDDPNSDTAHAARSTTLACVTTTPLGWPVEPEV